MCVSVEVLSLTLSIQVKWRNVHFVMWDIGGQESLRQAWSTYYTGTHFMILVVDSTDRERLTVAKEELYKMLGHEVSYKYMYMMYITYYIYTYMCTCTCTCIYCMHVCNFYVVVLQYDILCIYVCLLPELVCFSNSNSNINNNANIIIYRVIDTQYLHAMCTVYIQYNWWALIGK